LYKGRATRQDSWKTQPTTTTITKLIKERRRKKNEIRNELNMPWLNDGKLPACHKAWQVNVE
jgi:hypothetical protein